MAKHVQIELFNLQSYTSQPLAEDYKVMQMQEKPKESSYEQLELNLFPKQIDKGSFEYLKSAA